MHVVYDGHDSFWRGEEVGYVLGKVFPSLLERFPMSVACWAFEEEVMDGFSWCIGCWAVWRICFINAM